MAIRDHSLDVRIAESAKEEFLAYGFQKASLHQIADRAGITTGALYTRYAGKDAMFCSLVEVITARLPQAMEPVQKAYDQALNELDREKVLEALQLEEQMFTTMLSQNYDEFVLFFCRSSGSSVQIYQDQLIERKILHTVEALQKVAKREFNPVSVEILIHQQFGCYRKLLDRANSREEALDCTKDLAVFLIAGWKAIFDQVF